MTRKNNRILAVILSLVMVLSSLPMLGVAQLALFTPRAAAEDTEPLPGDADGDGYLTTADARLILLASNGTGNTDGFVGSGDLNGDGEIGVADAKYALNLASRQWYSGSAAPSLTPEDSGFDSIVCVVPAEECFANGTVEITVESSALSGVTDGCFVLTYAPEELTLDSFEMPLDGAVTSCGELDGGEIACAFLFPDEEEADEARLFQATFNVPEEPVDTELSVKFVTLNGGDDAWDSVSIEYNAAEPLPDMPHVYVSPSSSLYFSEDTIEVDVGLNDYYGNCSGLSVHDGQISLEYDPELIEFVSYDKTLDDSELSVTAEDGMLIIDFDCDIVLEGEISLLNASFRPLDYGNPRFDVSLTGCNGYSGTVFNNYFSSCYVTGIYSEDDGGVSIGDVFTYLFSVDDLSGVTEGELSFYFDPALLAFATVEELLGDGFETDRSLDEDHFNFSFRNTGAAPEGKTDLFYITLHAIDIGAAELRSEIVTWEGAEAPETIVVPVDITAGGDVGDLTWFLSTDRVLTISGEGELPGASLPDGESDEEMPWRYIRDSIREVVIEEGVTGISAWAFSNCSNLRTVYLPSTLEIIGEYAFFNCSTEDCDENGDWQQTDSLRRVELAVLPASIGFGAFRDDEALSEFNYPEGDLASACLGGERYVDWGVENWDECDRVRDVFGGTPFYDDWYYEHYMQGEIDGLTWYLEENEDSFLWNDWEDRPVEDGEEYEDWQVHTEPRYTLYISGEGAMPDFIYDDCRREGDEREERRQPWERERNNVTKLVIGEGVTEIGDRSFCWFNNLRDVTLPEESLVRIGEWAFELCQSEDDDGNVIDSLRGITIPASVTEIDRDAFRAVKYLEDIDYESLIDICLAGERYDDDRPDNDCDRVEAVFGDVDSFYDWRDAYYHEHYMQGECGANGDNLTWALEDTDGYWVYEDTGEPVEDENDFGAPGTRREPRYTLFITGEGDMKDFFYGDPELEEPYDPQPWERDRDKIAAVEIGPNVTSIGDSAFRWSSNLRMVNLPEDTLERIGEFAFEGCCSGEGEGEDWYPTDSLGYVRIPESVGYIGRGAFRNNPFLETVECSRDLREICLPDEDRDPVDRVREVFDDNTVFYQDWYAGLYLQGECGKDGDNLTWRLEDTDGFWAYDENGERVEDENDFDAPGTHWESRYTLYIEGEGDMKDFFYGNEEEGEESDPAPWDRDRWNIVAVELAPTVTSVGDSAFRWCGNLLDVTLPDGLLSIGEFAFEGCCSGEGEGVNWRPTGGLGSIVIPGSVTSIGERAFANDRLLDDVVYDSEDDVRTVCLAGERYEGWNVDDWDSIDRLRNVFDNTEYFDRVYYGEFMQGRCGENVTWYLEENKDGFLAHDLDNTPVGKDEEYDVNSVHWEPRYTLYIEGEGDMWDFVYEDFKDEGDERDEFRQPWERDRWQISRVDVGEGVTHIGDNAFRWSNNLRGVTLPEGLLSIGEWAFENCQDVEWHTADDYTVYDSLREISIPGTVTCIGRGAFTFNEFLEEVEFDGDLRDVCLNSEKYADMWDDGEDPFLAIARVSHVFDKTPFRETWLHDEYLSGSCGEDVEWELVYNEDSGWYDNETRERIADEDVDEEDGSMHYEPRFTLVIKGEGRTQGYLYTDFWYVNDEEEDVPLPWDLFLDDITAIEVQEGVTGLLDFTMTGRNVRRIDLPASLDTIDELTFCGLESLSVINVAEGNTVFRVYNGALYDKDLTMLVIYPVKSVPEEFTAPCTVRDIAVSAFEYATSLKTLYLFGNESDWEGFARELLPEGLEVVFLGYYHDWDDGEITTPKGCLTPGVKTYTCSFCGTTYTEDIPAYGSHDLVDHAAKAATCTEVGWNAYQTCSRCDYTTRVDIPAKGHGETELRGVRAATCTEDGYTGDTYCKDCNQKIADGTAVNAPGHSWGEWTVVTAATCTEKGVEKRVCGRDSTHVETRDVAAKGHGETELRGVRAATCTEDGYTGDTYCKVCNTKLADGTAVNAVGHSWGEWTVVTAATCTEKGVEKRVCGKDPTHVETRDVAAKGHGETELRGVRAATCTEAGYTGDTYCKVCNTKLADGQIVPASGHSWGEWTVVTAATCTETGVEKRVCGKDPTHAETRDVAAKGHADENGDGICDRCSQSLKPADPPSDNIFEIPEGGGIKSFESDGILKLATINPPTGSLLAGCIVFPGGGELTVRDKDGKVLDDGAKLGTGSTVTVNMPGHVTVTRTVVVLGDTDGDASITAVDARLALRTAAKLDTLSGPFAMAADPDGENGVNATDARMILRAAAKLSSPEEWSVAPASEANVPLPAARR